MIFIDYNQVCIAALTSQAGYGSSSNDIDLGYIRHLIINSLRSFRQKYHREYGELVICCDTNDGYWRREYFQYYKANRKKSREESNLDWNLIFTGLDTVRTELQEYFPYPVIRVSKTEGDDAIAVLCEWATEHDLQTDGLWEGEPNKQLIISADGDLIQLQRLGNHVKQYDNTRNRWLKSDLPIEKFIIEHIIEGDGVDGIPNTLSADNCLVDKIRQTSLRKDRRAEFMEKGIDACRTDEERAYYERNTTLVDLRCIPDYIKDGVLDLYHTERERCSKLGRRKVMNYLIKNRMKLLLDNLNDF